MAEVILVILDVLILMNTVRLKTSIPDVGMQINIIVYSM